jgi:tRNA G18 (ribose-2'-O)-methylase SpoU
MIIGVTDPHDERLRDYLAVGDPDLARRTGTFVAEGREVVRRLLESARHPVRSLLVSASGREALTATLDRLAASVPVYEVPQALIESITGYNIHRGCLALAGRPPDRAWGDVLPREPGATAVVLERVGNADNVGGVFRNAHGLGASAVLLSDGCVDPLYRKAIRTSMGAALLVPFARLSPWPRALTTLRALGWRVAALSPRADRRLDDWVRTVDRAERVAVLAGHEGEGLSDEALEAADERVSIPMVAAADSLNVAVAVAIALYELGKR